MARAVIFSTAWPSRLRTGLALVLAIVGAATAQSQPTSREGVPLVDVQSNESPRSRLSPDSRLRDLLGHPAFKGFTRLLLPWDGRQYDEDMSFDNIGSLMPYHSHVTPRVVVGALNRLIEDAADGQTIFYPIYSGAQRQANPALTNTGLFFFRGRPDAPFVIIAAGGGFSYVGSLHEGFPLALQISGKGYNAFVLKYRVGGGGTLATEDLAAAISYVFQNAEALRVSRESYSLWGGSAGARMVAAIGTFGVARFGGQSVPRPATVVMAYTAYSDYSADDPPTFVIVGDQDRIAPPATMERRVTALRQAGVEVEFRKYANLGHGFGLGTGTSAEGWVEDAVRFWERFMRRR